MADFGYKTIEASTVTIENYIKGSKFTCPADCLANSITAYINPSSTSFTIRCYIYLDADKSLVTNGVTEERTGISGADWYTFDFEGTRPELSAETVYILCVHANSIAGTCVSHYHTGDTGQGASDFDIYNSIEDPLMPTSGNNEHCIYCTYAAAVEHSITVAEILGFLEDDSKQHTHKKTTAEILGFLENDVPKWDAHITVDEILGMVEDDVPKWDAHMTVTEILGMVEDSAKAAAYKQLSAESLGFLEAVATKAAFHMTQAEVITFLESIAYSKKQVITAAEILSFKDRMRRRKKLGWARDLRDHHTIGGADVV